MKNTQRKHYEKRRGLTVVLTGWLTTVSLFACTGFVFLRVKGEQDRLLRASRQIQGEMERLQTDIASHEADIKDLSSRPNLERILLAKESRLTPVSASRVGVLGEPEVSSKRLAQNRHEEFAAGAD